MAELRVARSELILGAPDSGKTARARALAASWLAQSQQHRAVYIVTDEEVRGEGAGPRPHAEPVPRLSIVQEPLEVAHAIGRHSRSDTLVVVDCLTLWLTARLMPAVLPGPSTQAGGSDAAGRAAGQQAPGDSLFLPEATGGRAGQDVIAPALRACAGPIVLVSNEALPEVAPAGPGARAFFEALGGLNREAAAACERVTLVSAGLPLVLKGYS